MTSELRAPPRYESHVPAKTGIYNESEVVSRQSLVVSQESDLYAAFSSTIEELLSSLLATGDWRLATPLAVALSGGADSLALTLLTQEWVDARGVSIIALTVDHRLREDSTAEAQQVASLMHAHGITHHILTPTHRPAGNNRMQAARQWRYDALADFCLEHAIQHCLLGHHYDDQLETVALAHVRGHDQLDVTRAPSMGEAGMRPSRTYRGIHFLRPLLAHTKADLGAYLKARGVSWIEDPTNADLHYARTRMRERLTTDAAFRQTITALFTTRQASVETLEQVMAQAMPLCVEFRMHAASLALAPWRALEAELRSLLLANLIRQVGGKPHRPRRAETLRLAEALLNEPRGKRTLGHCLIAWKNGEATLRHEARVQKITPPPST